MLIGRLVICTTSADAPICVTVPPCSLCHSFIIAVAARCASPSRAAPDPAPPTAQCRNSIKLCALYLCDSIAKNVGAPYPDLFAKDIDTVRPAACAAPPPAPRRPRC